MGKPEQPRYQYGNRHQPAAQPAEGGRHPYKPVEAEHGGGEEYCDDACHFRVTERIDRSEEARAYYPPEIETHTEKTHGYLLD
jgi:hypothetical protein